jgi:hypothetical protein
MPFDSVRVPGRPVFRRAPWIVIALVLVVVGASACTTVRPRSLESGSLVIRAPFSHAGFAPVLSRFVDEQGQVDYAGLRAEPRALDRYYYRVARYSPDSNPELFPTEAARLAYWINGYNAAVLSAVVRRDSLDSVLDVRPPFPFFFLPRQTGFFVFQRVRLGGKSSNLWSVETRIRKQYKDPRIHFALNCASRGCPRLPQTPFQATELDAQLDREARAFVAEPRNVRIDEAERVVYLSSIFDWYRSDFLEWLAEHSPGATPTLLAYVTRYATAEQASALGRAADYEVRFVPYDWGLNAQDDPGVESGADAADPAP